MGRKIALHKTDIMLDKDKLSNILNEKELGFAELHRRVVAKYGLDLTYKSFMHLCSNRASWKLLYAYAIVDILNINIDDIFKVIDIDIDKKLEEKKEWQKQYQKNK